MRLAGEDLIVLRLRQVLGLVGDTAPVELPGERPKVVLRATDQIVEYQFDVIVVGLGEPFPQINDIDILDRRSDYKRIGERLRTKRHQIVVENLQIGVGEFAGFANRVVEAVAFD